MGFKHSKTQIIGICGISRAGKTTLRNTLVEYLKKHYLNKYRIEHFTIDEYYIRPQYVFDQNLQKTIGFSLYNNRDFPFEFFKKVRIFAIDKRNKFN